MRLLVLAAAAAVLSASQPQTGWKHLIGQGVPPISARTWLNAGALTPDLETLAGKVWLLEFFAST